MVSTWHIDDTLTLCSAPSIPDSAMPVRMPEQAIDSLMLRNLRPICTALFGKPASLLFSSSIYWGEFDIACVLEDGQVAAFENKRGKATAHDLRKFCNDIRHITAEGPLYLAHRWQHVKDNWDDYLALSRRMFAAFFLGLRCDTEPDARDLVAEAANHLGITKRRLIAMHDANIDWLNRIRGPVTRKSRGHVGLYDYLKAEGVRLSNAPVQPVLVSPGTTLSRVHEWSTSLDQCIGQQAMLVDCGFYAEGKPYPTWFRVEPLGRFAL